MESNIPSDAPRPRLCHIVKRDDFNGFGFNLHAQKARPGQFIGIVDPDSPADRAGLREGDCIVEVNGVNIAHENHKQVVERIRAVPNETSLLVVDKTTEDYFRKLDIVVSKDLPNVLRLSSSNVEGQAQPDAAKPPVGEEFSGKLAKFQIEEDDDDDDDDVVTSVKGATADSPKSSMSSEAKEKVDEPIKYKDHVDVKVDVKVDSDKIVGEVDTNENEGDAEEEKTGIDVERISVDVHESFDKDGVDDEIKVSDKVDKQQEEADIVDQEINEETQVEADKKEIVVDRDPKDENVASEKSVESVDKQDFSVEVIVEKKDVRKELKFDIDSEKTASVKSESGSSIRSTPSPVPNPISESGRIGDWDGLNLNMTAAEMRERIGSKKKRDPRKDKSLDLRKKYEIIQTL